MQNIEDSLNSEFEEIDDEILRKVRKMRKVIYFLLISIQKKKIANIEENK